VKLYSGWRYQGGRSKLPQAHTKGAATMSELRAIKDILKAITKEPNTVVCLAALGVAGFALYVVLEAIK